MNATDRFPESNFEEGQIVGGRHFENCWKAEGLTWLGIAGVGILAESGFTVARFITGLSFDDETLIATSKIAVLAAFLAAGSLGYIWLRFALKEKLTLTQGRRACQFRKILAGNFRSTFDSFFYKFETATKASDRHGSAGLDGARSRRLFLGRK